MSETSTRVRLIYEKRDRACFVPHVALSTLFARAARRAGIELSRTEGFSPRAKISFGPELPAGVVALNEPVDMWLSALDLPGDMVEAFNAQMPDGFRVKRCGLPAEGAPALGKECKAAHYLVWTKNGLFAGTGAAELLTYMERHYGESVLNGFVEQDLFSRVSVVLANPAQNGIGGLVKALIADSVVAGWHDMCIVRTCLGRWNGEQMEPTEEGRRVL